MKYLERADWILVLWWTLATSIGWLAGFIVCEALTEFLEGFSTSADGLVIGAGVGIAQAFVLRGRMSGARWWVLGSIVGFGVGLAAADQTDGLPELVYLVAGGVLLGAAVGIGQWLVLRLRATRTLVWVAASVVGWGLAWGLALHSEGVEGSWVPYVVGAAAAALAGVVTGVILTWIWRTQPTATGSSEA